MQADKPVDRFGLIVIGDEILAGKRRDRHFEGIGGMLRSRGFRVAWFRILPDEPDLLVVELARSIGFPAVELAAQSHAIGFYERHGFAAYGPEFLDADIPHRNMRLAFEPPR